MRCGVAPRTGQRDWTSRCSAVKPPRHSGLPLKARCGGKATRRPVRLAPQRNVGTPFVCSPTRAQHQPEPPQWVMLGGGLLSFAEIILAARLVIDRHFPVRITLSVDRHGGSLRAETRQTGERRRNGHATPYYAYYAYYATLCRAMWHCRLPTEINMASGDSWRSSSHCSLTPARANSHPQWFPSFAVDFQLGALANMFANHKAAPLSDRS